MPLPPLKRFLKVILPAPVYGGIQRVWRSIFRVCWWPVYRLTLAALSPASAVLAVLRRRRVHPDSVLHISYAIHTAHATVEILRRHGIRADYLAIGDNPHWTAVDFRAPVATWPHQQAWREFRMFWDVVSQYEIVHCHFMHTMSRSGWELRYLKRLGRTIVAHYRGCEIRDRALNMRLHPEVNICQDCDYNAAACSDASARRRRALGAKYGDLALVTTPDMRDFLPGAVHLPFFAPEEAVSPDATRARTDGAFRVVHATNHPGIEGTEAIRRAVTNLRARGFAIEFVCLRDTSHREVLDALRDADLAIGKMKMGYYANFQIESMALGVPTITWVRPEFMTPELEASGFIFSRLSDLESTLEYYLTHPDALQQKRRLARASVLALHDNDRIAEQLIGLYRRTKTR